MDDEEAERPRAQTVWGLVRARLDGPYGVPTIAALGVLAVTSFDGQVLVTLASFAGVVIVAMARARPLKRAHPRRSSRLAGDLRLEPAALADALSDPTLILRRAGTVANLNEAARQVFPRARTDVPISFLIRAPDVLEALDRVRTGGRSEVARLANRGAGERSFDVSISLLPQRAGEPVLLVQLKDITEAQRIGRMRTDFVANASHELRTPLASVLGFIETLQGPAKEDAAARERFLGIMAQQAMRMSRLIDDLLSLSKVEERAHVRPRDVLDLWDVVVQVADGLAPLAREHGVEIRLVRETLETTVRGDRDELTRVLENLTENAIKYGRDGKHVTLTASRADSQIAVAVRDYGPGVAPEDLPRLTERFYRVDVAGSRAMGGTGLGLALAKNILLRHGGRLVIASTLGEGATFTAELPLARS